MCSSVCYVHASLLVRHCLTQLPRAKHGLKSKDQEQQDKLDAKSLKSKQHIAMQDTHFDVKEEDQPEVRMPTS